jgi:ubiquitin carboxyl-terminal hydrolase 7
MQYGLADLQLDVKGCRDVYSSFDKYVEVERLEGDNKYHAENHGLQVMNILLLIKMITYARVAVFIKIFI